MRPANTLLIAACALFFCTFMTLGISTYLVHEPEVAPSVSGTCLSEHQVAMSDITEIPDRSGFITISIIDVVTNSTSSSFRSDILQPSHYHPVELLNCHAYFSRVFGFDREKNKPTSEYRSELWQFNYGGEGRALIRLDEIATSSEKKYTHYFSNDFRVNSRENFVALERDYPGDANYAIVIRSIKTLQDVFVLNASDLRLKYPTLGGDFMLKDWTKDGRYFWANIIEAAYINGFVRVDTKDWSYEVYEVPAEVLGGYPLNIETGWVPYMPGAFWTGVQELDDQVKDERKEMGHTADLYLYNVFTKESILIEDTDESIWRGLEGRWISDTEFSYRLPTGERKVYIIGAGEQRN